MGPKCPEIKAVTIVFERTDTVDRWPDLKTAVIDRKIEKELESYKLEIAKEVIPKRAYDK
ncbi:hypothetical protein ACTXT7_000703 [Hymenolepis weldensis]